MSWDQGFQDRDTIPPKFLAWADSQGEKRGWGQLEYITWFGSEPNILFLDYGDHGALKVDFAKPSA